MSAGSAGRPVIGYVSERFFLTDWARSALGDLGDLRLLSERSDLAGCHVLCAHFLRQLTAEDLEAAPDAMLIVHPGTAILCDMVAASRLGIVVVHFPGLNAISVAEHTLGLMLDVVKGITASDRELRAGVSWLVGERRLFRTELAGKVLGLAGFGSVAQQVARIAGTGFGMEVQVWSRRGDAVRAAGFRWQPHLDELLRTSDVVSLHLTLNADTRELFDRRRIGLLQPHAVLVNTARADLVDIEALKAALADGRLAGAAFDVWSDERPSPHFPLLSAPNALMTHHNAGLTHEASARTMQAVVDCVRQVLAGDPPKVGRIANPEVWERRRALSLRPH
jgi:D-3-phosphoglycerate dehydrogenase